MPHDLTIERTAVAPYASPRVLALITASLVAVIVMLLAEVGQDAPGAENNTVTSEEDWHGNVKRSYWTP